MSPTNHHCVVGDPPDMQLNTTGSYKKNIHLMPFKAQEIKSKFLPLAQKGLPNE